MRFLTVGMIAAVYLTFLAFNSAAQTFEVASVKPADPNSRGTMIRMPNSTFQATGITVRNSAN
jgi:hypothetical protein